jgi:hypothetical protein
VTQSLKTTCKPEQIRPCYGIRVTFIEHIWTRYSWRPRQFQSPVDRTDIWPGGACKWEQMRPIAVSGRRDSPWYFRFTDSQLQNLIKLPVLLPLLYLSVISSPFFGSPFTCFFLFLASVSHFPLLPLFSLFSVLISFAFISLFFFIFLSFLTPNFLLFFPNSLLN